MRLKSQTRDPQLEVPPGGLVLRIFTSWKNPSISAGFEPVNLGSGGEHVTSRPPRPTSVYKLIKSSLNEIDRNANTFCRKIYFPHVISMSPAGFSINLFFSVFLSFFILATTPLQSRGPPDVHQHIFPIVIHCFFFMSILYKAQ